MPHTIRKQPNYLVIGIFLSIGILGILTSVIFADKLVNRLKGGYPIYIKFDNLDGLVPGSKIIVGSGKHIGQVDAVDLDGSILIVTAFIDNKYKINKSAKFEILSTSLVGGKYLSVENYTGEAPYIVSGDELTGVEPVTINSLLGMFTDSFGGTNSTISGDLSGIIKSVSETVNTINVLLKDNRTNLNVTLNNVASASKYLNSTLSNINKKIAMVNDQEFRKAITETTRSLQNLDLFLQDINSPNAPLSLLKDPKMKQSLQTIITNLEETTERVKAKPSLLLRS